MMLTIDLFDVIASQEGVLMSDDFAFRFEYADRSAFEVFADGTAYVVQKDGRREQKHGVIINRIPALIGMAAKPRQDEIERLSAQVETAKAYLDRAIASYHGDPADNNFQRGFLAALEVVRSEAFSPFPSTERQP